MKTIQILHSSLLGYVLTIYIKYRIIFHYQQKAKIIQSRDILYKYNTSIYFIIKSPNVEANKVNHLLKNIRKRSNEATIILIGEHINYEQLFSNHYKVFGVVDTTKDKSLSFLIKQLNFYLEGLYSLK